MGAIGLVTFLGLTTLLGLLALAAAVPRGGKLHPFDALLFGFPVGSGLLVWWAFLASWPLGYPINGKTTIVGLGILLALSGAGVVLRRNMGLVIGIFPWLREHLSASSILGRWQALSTLAKVELACVAGIGILLVLRSAGAIYSVDQFIYYLPNAERIYLYQQLPTDIGPGQVEYTRAFPPYMWITYALSYQAYGGINYFLPRMLHDFMWLASLALLYRFSRSLLGRSTEASLASVVIAITLSTIGYQANGPIFLLFSLGGLYFLVQGLTQEGRFPLLLPAALLAMGVWTRYHAVYWVVALVAALAIVSVLASKVQPLTQHPSHITHHLSRFTFQKPDLVSLTRIGLLAVLTALLSSPYLIRNAVLWGNPAYPGWANYLGGYLMDKWTIENIWSVYHVPLFYGFSLEGLTEMRLHLVVLFIAWLALDRWRGRWLESFLALAAVLEALAWLAVMKRHGTAEAQYMLPGLFLFALLAGPVLVEAVENKLPKMVLTLAGALFLLELAMELGYHLHGDGIRGLIFYARPLGLSVIFLAILILPWLLRGIKLPKPFVSHGIALSLILVLTYPSFLAPVFGSTGIVNSFRRGSFFDFVMRDVITPEGPWMQEHLPSDAVLLTFDTREYLIPRRIQPGETPLLRKAYEATDVEVAVQELKKAGVTHIYLSGFWPHPLLTKAPLFRFLGDERYFELVYSHTGRDQFLGQERAVEIYRIR